MVREISYFVFGVNVRVTAQTRTLESVFAVSRLEGFRV